ncbi:MAG: ABC transporter permease subunit [Candidatus Eisenbacteria sp.]|nr:ABC transporter permease subunit [Candidatus Eisenbacteria bacterium]
MRKTIVLASKEFRGFLRMPLGYALLAVYALVTGMVFMALLYLFREQILRVAQQAQLAMPSRPVVDVQISLVTPYLLNAAALLIFMVPFLTMRSFAQEKHSRSLEVLVSFPLSAWEIVAGKFLGVLCYTLLLLGITAVHLVILSFISTPELLPTLGGFVGLVLFAMTLVAIGLFVSSLTTGQVEAAVLTLGLFMGLVMASETGGSDSSWLRTVLVYLSPLHYYEEFGRGMLPFDGLFFYLGATVLFMALTLRGVDLLKWRG